MEDNTSFDIFEPDNRGVTSDADLSPTVLGFTAFQAPKHPIVSAGDTLDDHESAPYTVQTSLQVIPSITSQASRDIPAGNIHVGPSADIAAANIIRTAENEPVTTTQMPATPNGPEPVETNNPEASTTLSLSSTPSAPFFGPALPPRGSSLDLIMDQYARKDWYPKKSMQELVKMYEKYSNIVTLIQQGQSTQITWAEYKSALRAMEISLDFKQEIFDQIHCQDWYEEVSLLQLAVHRETMSAMIALARKGAFTNKPVTAYQDAQQQIQKLLNLKQDEAKAFNSQKHLNMIYPAGVINAKNATDPHICADLQPSPHHLDPETELQDAIEAWRDTVDGRIEDYGNSTSGEHWWMYMEYEDFDGTDNNQYHDYFPEVPPKAVYHSTGVQTRLITSPGMHEVVYGHELSDADCRKITRIIGAPEYVDQSEFRYGEPFLDPHGPYLDIQTETQDSGFQTMDFEVREANIIKAQKKSAVVASHLNKLSLERSNGFRVFAEPTKDRIVHSQQFSTRVTVNTDGTVESFGSFTPMIHNVVYEVRKESMIPTVQILAAPLSASSSSTTVRVDDPPSASSTSPTLSQSKIAVTKTTHLNRIPSYYSSPSPSLYDDAQIKDSEFFEIGWPGDRFPITEIDGAYSKDVMEDFAIPDPKCGHKTAPQNVRVPTRKTNISTQNSSATTQTQHTQKLCTSTQGLHASARMQQPGAPTQTQSSRATVHNLYTPIQKEGKGRKKRRMDEISDEGYNSNSPPSSHKRLKHQKRNVTSSSHFAMPYGTSNPSSIAQSAAPAPAHPVTATPKMEKSLTVSPQTSSKRKRDAPNADERHDSKEAAMIVKSDNPTEQPDSKRPRFSNAGQKNLTTTRIRRLPPTESTLKVIIPREHQKSKPKMGQTKLVPVATESIPKDPVKDVSTQPEKTREKKPTPQPVQSQQTPTRPRGGWADRKPSGKRNKEGHNPHRWNNVLGPLSGGSTRQEPYNAKNRPSRRN